MVQCSFITKLFILQKWFEREETVRKRKLNEENATKCQICGWKSASRSHLSRCKRYSKFLSDKSTTTCPNPKCNKKFKNRGGLYSHFDFTKCKPYGDNSNDANAAAVAIADEMHENYGFEDEMEIDENKQTQDNSPVISTSEGNSAHYSGTCNDNMERDNENDSITDELEDEHLLDFLKDLDFQELNIFFGSRSFAVHKFKLAKSPVFKKMIMNNEEIRIPKEDYKATMETLRFLYREEISAYKIIDPLAALSGGIKFELEGLKEVSEKCLEEIQLTEDLSCVLYESYDKLNATLISKIEDYMFSNIETICDCGRLQELIVKRPDFLCKIVKAALSRKPEKA